MDINRFEREVLDAVEHALLAESSALAALNLEVQAPEISITQSERGSKNSEVVLYVWRAGTIVDVVEFHVLRNDQPVATLDEIERWLRDTLVDVVRRQRP